jgi:5,10-methylenetetrahydromethanopterin reductase
VRFGALISGSTIDEIVANVESHRREGFTSAWLTDGLGYDPLSVLGIVGREVGDIELGTAVVRTYPRHPLELAQQALTINDAVDGRLVLGIGPSHQPVVERTWGLSFDRPLRHTTEYLSVLAPLLRHAEVSFTGEVFSAHATLHIEGGVPCPVLLGALGPSMLDLAGAVCDGIVTFMVGPQTLVDLSAPRVRAAAGLAGRPTPRVVAMLPVLVTDDVDAARVSVARNLEGLISLPSYAAAVEREGGTPLVGGSASDIRAQIDQLEDAGVTDVVATRVVRRSDPDHRRTEDLLQELRAQN